MYTHTPLTVGCGANGARGCAQDFTTPVTPELRLRRLSITPDLLTRPVTSGGEEGGHGGGVKSTRRRGKGGLDSPEASVTVVAHRKREAVVGVTREWGNGVKEEEATKSSSKGRSKRDKVNALLALYQHREMPLYSKVLTSTLI